jgi:hypothetical protein
MGEHFVGDGYAECALKRFNLFDMAQEQEQILSQEHA